MSRQSIDYVTERGALLARLEWSSLGTGHYLVEGYTVERCYPRPFPWRVEGGGTAAAFPTFTDALRWINEEVHGYEPPID